MKLPKLGRLSPPILALIGVVVAAGLGGGGYYAYEMYDYVQHDNDFCLSCHLMEQPYELFAQSAHQGLGCKACHQPTLLGRSQMALTQILENPEELSVHAEVPNEICASCHIEGDPERWRVVSQTAGHRVHLESDEPSLEGLQCVECHSTSIHEFAPIDRTCSQAGCHTDAVIQLAGMSDLTIHCATCHEFVAPLEGALAAAGGGGGALGAVGPGSTGAVPVGAAGPGGRRLMQPDFNQCFTCHVMRTLVEMPAPDPHMGNCGSCHNPHTQAEPADAAGSCATAGCHSDPRALTPYHEGLATEVVSGCLQCHVAHDFALDGSDCAACHTGAGATDASAAAGGRLQLDFRHEDHPEVSCASCHTSTEAHGTVTMASVQDCRSCHHTEPVSATCASCHVPEDAPTRSFSRVHSLVLSVGAPDAARRMRFPHDSHSDLDCASCHTEGSALAPPPDLDCASCHAEHHTPVSDCAACHTAAPAEAHPPTEAHVTCSGSSCHQDVPFEGVPRTRQFCLGCHQDLGDHNPTRPCVECHVLPAPRAPGAA